MLADTLPPVPPLAASAGVLAAGAGWIGPVLGVVGVYLLVGVIVGGLGLVRLAPRADPDLRASSASVRLLLLPGAVAVWPLAVRVWVRRARSADRRTDAGAGS